jgi:nucleoside triphosphatase
MRQQQFPEPTVGALIVNRNGDVFLMRSHKWNDNYALPGGHIDLGERIEDAVKREVKEETNLDVYDLEFLCFQQFIYDDAFYQKRHYIFFDFACKTDAIDVALNDEAEEYVWVPLDEAERLLSDRYTRRVIDIYRRRVEQP